MDYSTERSSTVLKTLGTSQKGLSLAEAGKRLKQNGPNWLPAVHTNRFRSLIKDQCNDVFFLLLLLATAISVYLHSGYAATALLVVIVLHVVANTVYMSKRYRFVGHVERLLARQVAVIRGGKQLHIDSSELVVGDIIRLDYGESVPADVRLVETERFATDDFDLQGSGKTAVIKHTATGASSVVRMGTSVVSGSARGAVIATGSQTYLGQLVGSVDAIQALIGVPARGLRLLRQRLGWTAGGLAVILIICSLVGHVELREFWLCVAVLAVAAVPSELVAALALSRRAVPVATERIIACALHNVAAKLGLVILSIFGLLVFHIPLAITVISLLIIDVVGTLVPASAIDGDAKTRVGSSHLVGFGLFAAGLSYASFLLYFESRGLSPVRIDTGSALYFQATMLACLTIILCQFVNIMLIRADEHKRFFTRHVWNNNHLLVALTLSLIATLFIIYSPLAHRYLLSGILGWGDWGTAILAAIIYFGFRLLQRHTRHHTRTAVLRDHSPEALRNHPKLA